MAHDQPYRCQCQRAEYAIIRNRRMGRMLTSRNVDVREGKARPLRLVIGENNADLAMTMGTAVRRRAGIHCVAIAASARAVLSALDAHSPDAFVLDLSLDDGSSLPLIAILRQRSADAAIVVFTGYKNE